jgi:hypothetical protein
MQKPKEKKEKKKKKKRKLELVLKKGTKSDLNLAVSEAGG